MKPTQEQLAEWVQTAENLTAALTFAYEAGRKDENEACAKVCEDAYLSERTALFAAGLIRARREQ